MKKTVLSMIILFLLVYSYLPAQNSSASEAYIKAMTSNSPEERVRLLKDYLSKFSGQGSEYENFANANLALLNYSGKTQKDTTRYGEKALTLGGLDDLTKCQVLVTVAGVYSNSGENLEKAKTYSMQAVNAAKANKDKEDSGATPAQWNQLVGAGYYVHAQAMEKTNNNSGAVDSYIASYNILKNKQIATSLANLGKSLYEAKSYAAAEKAFKIATPILGDFGSTVLFAKTLHRLDKKDEALKYYKQAYTKQKSGEIAYNIGLILAGKTQSNPALTNETIQYLLDASFLSPANSKKAMDLAERLYFNKDPKYNESIKAIAEKSKNIEDLTNTFNQKFGEKTEEELSDAEKNEMQDILKKIEAEQNAIAKLQSEQQLVLESFSKLIENTKQKLGVS